MVISAGTGGASGDASAELEGLLSRFDETINADPSAAFALAQEALGLVSTEHERARALVRLGWAERMLSRLRDAEAHNDEALRVFEAVGDVENHTLALILAGAIDVYTGQRERAYPRLTRALEQARALGHRAHEARACNALGALFDWYSNPALALEYLLEALRLMRELNQPLMEHMALSNIGAIYYRQGEYERALECYRASLEGLRALKATMNVGILLLNIGETLTKLQRAAEAEPVLEEGLALMRAAQHVAAEVFALRNLGAAQLAQGRALTALETHRAALELARQNELAEEESLARLGVGEALMALGRPAEARLELEIASAGLEQSSAENRLEAFQALVTAHEALGQYREALGIQRRYSELEREYRETSAQRHAQGLMLRFELAQTQRETADALARNRDLETLVAEKEGLAAELERLSLQDPLTALYNRRYLDLHFPEMLGAFALKASPVSVALLDIDHFKRVNDDFSHLIGDQVLRQIARLVLENIRQGDIGVRFGGEEFLVIFPDTDLEFTFKLCERLRQKIAEFDWGRIHHELSITISIGVAVSQGTDNAEALLARADALLYRAKASGRNRVVHSLAAPEPAPS